VAALLATFVATIAPTLHCLRDTHRPLRQR
jgi:hypothetical protein